MKTILKEDVTNINSFINDAIELYRSLGAIPMNDNKQFIIFIAGCLLFQTGRFSESIIKGIFIIALGRKRMSEFKAWRKIKQAYEANPQRAKEVSKEYNDKL